MLTSSNRVKSRICKFILKKSGLENYSVKSWLKSLKFTKSWFKHSLFFCESIQQKKTKKQFQSEAIIKQT